LEVLRLSPLVVHQKDEDQYGALTGKFVALCEIPVPVLTSPLLHCQGLKGD